MNKLQMNDLVRLERTYVSGIDYYPADGDVFEKGIIGVVCEVIDDETVFVEFDNDKFKGPVMAIPNKYLTKIK